MIKNITKTEIRTIRKVLLEELDALDSMLSNAKGTALQEAYGEGYLQGCTDTVAWAIKVIDETLKIHREDL